MEVFLLPTHLLFLRSFNISRLVFTALGGPQRNIFPGSPFESINTSDVGVLRWDEGGRPKLARELDFKGVGMVAEGVNTTFLALPGAFSVPVGRPTIDFRLRSAVGKNEHLLFFELFCKSSTRCAVEVIVSGSVSDASIITTSTVGSTATCSIEVAKELMTLQSEIDEILSNSFSTGASNSSTVGSLNCRSREGFRSNRSLHPVIQ